jgi:penicillin G amidase
MRTFGRIITVLVVVVVVLGLIVGGGLTYVTRRPFPQVSGKIYVTGPQGVVTVTRDRSGVPHIYADTPHDLFFAQGYVTAQDRLWQMEFSRRIGAGRLSEILGKSTLGDDLFIRAIGWRRAAEADYQLLEASERDVLQWYADGVTAFINTHLNNLPLEFIILGLTGAKFKPEPWTPVDTLTWGKVMAWDLGGNWEDELLRSRLLAQHGSERGQQIINALWPPYPAGKPIIVPGGVAWQDLGQGALTEAASLRQLLQTGKGEIGSNNWVIAGSRTATGKPLLANDMHLAIQMPSIWYEVGLHCETVSPSCPYNVTGYVFPGVPGVVVGHNDRIAWAVTNLGPDVQDLYLERVNPQNPNQVEFQGKWEDVQVVPETVRIAGKNLPKDFQPTANMQVTYDPATDTTSVVSNVRVTRHGPILNDVVKSLRASPQAVAMKWTAIQPGASAVPALLAIDRAQNWDEFRAALRRWDVPSQNFIFADVDGNIGYQAPGLIPIRANPAKTSEVSGDGALPVPGWTGDHEWTGYIPFDELPSRFNPAEGFIVTANHAVVDATYPYLIARDWDYGYRAQRLTDMIRAREKLSIDDVKTIQGDNYSVFADQLMPYLKVIRANSPLQQAALDALTRWDRVDRRDSVGASVFEATVFNLVLAAFGDDLGPELVEDYWGGGATQRAAIGALLDRPNDPMWDDTSTAGRAETRDDVLQRAFEEACKELASRLGGNVSQWTWGRLHTTTFRNGSLGKSGVAFIEAIFNRGPVVTDGSSTVVNNTSYSAKPGDRYAVVHGPSERYIADLADWGRSLSVHTTGQSGHPFNKHYDDFIDLWRNIQYHPMLWSRADVEKNAEGTLTLIP